MMMVLGMEHCPPPLPMLSPLHTGCVGAVFNAVFYKLCNLWCCCARVKAGIHLCCKRGMRIKRLLQQSALHSRKQWDTAHTHLVRTRGVKIWIIKTNIHAPKMLLGRAGRNSLGKCWCLMFLLLCWQMAAHHGGENMEWGCGRAPQKHCAWVIEVNEELDWNDTWEEEKKNTRFQSHSRIKRQNGQKVTFLSLESGDLLECYLHLDKITRKFKIRNKPTAGLWPHSKADGKLWWLR